MPVTEEDTIVLWPLADHDVEVDLDATAPIRTLPAPTLRQPVTGHDSQQTALSRRFLLTLLRVLSAWNT